VCVSHEDCVGLVEGNMTVISDSHQLDVCAAKRGNQVVVFRASSGDIAGKSVGNMGVFGGDVDVVKQVSLHKAAVTLLMLRA